MFNFPTRTPPESVTKNDSNIHSTHRSLKFKHNDGTSTRNDLTLQDGIPAEELIL